MKYKRGILCFALSISLSVAINAGNKVKVAILMNGDACNIAWEDRLTKYDVINASVKNFLAGQYDWNLEERLISHKPDYCLLYAGLPDILLQIPLPKIVEAYKHLCEKLKGNNISPIIITTLPVGAHPAMNAQLTLLNMQLREYAATGLVSCFDASAGLTDGNVLMRKYTEDGVTLNNLGKAIFSGNISGYLDDLIRLKQGKVAPKSTTDNLVSEGINKIMSASPSQVGVVMLGNSITAGGGDWNKWLNRTDVRNAGQGGYTSGQLLWYVDTCVVSVHPHICFIMAGINDLFNNVPAELIYQNQVAILKKLTDHHIKPVMQCTLYMHNNPEMNKKVDKINDAIKKYCKDNNIDYMDVNASLSGENGLRQEFTTDGTHLTQEAYKIWAKMLTSFLKDAGSL